MNFLPKFTYFPIFYFLLELNLNFHTVNNEGNEKYIAKMLNVNKPSYMILHFDMTNANPNFCHQNYFCQNQTTNCLNSAT